MKLVIAGAFYYDRNSDTIFAPHYTGEYVTVDCDEYVTMDELKDNYDDSYIKTVKDSPVEFEGKQYYSAEWGPFNIGNWELLSDLSDLRFNEDNRSF
jgi:hypothetical protein